MATLLTPLPTVGELVKTFDPKLLANLQELQGFMANNSLTKQQLLTDHCTNCSIQNETAGTYMPSAGGGGVGATIGTDSMFYFDPADLQLSGVTAKYRFRTVCITNQVAPGITLTPGLARVTGAITQNGDGIANQFGVAATTSIVTHVYASPAASSVTVSTDDFLITTAGMHVMQITLSAQQTAGACTMLIMSLQGFTQ